MPNSILAIAEVSISAGKIHEFKKRAAEIIAKVDANEPGTFSYEYFLSDDESKGFVVQTYKDSEAVMAHLENIADLATPFHEIAPLSGLTIFGSLSDESSKALEPVNPRIYEHWNGVSR